MSLVTIAQTATFNVLLQIANGHTRLETFLARLLVRYGNESPISATFLISTAMLFSSTLSMFALAMSMLKSNLFTVRMAYALSMLPSVLFSIRSIHIIKKPHEFEAGAILAFFQTMKCALMATLFVVPSNRHKDLYIMVLIPIVFDIVFFIMEAITTESPKKE